MKLYGVNYDYITDDLKLESVEVRETAKLYVADHYVSILNYTKRMRKDDPRAHLTAEAALAQACVDARHQVQKFKAKVEQAERDLEKVVRLKEEYYSGKQNNTTANS